MSTIMHSFDRTPKANSDLSKYFDNHEKRKQEVKASYQISSKEGSPRHGLMLMSTSFYQKLNLKSSKEPVLPYQEALARKPQYKIAQSIRSQSLPRVVGIYPNHLYQANESYSTKRNDLLPRDYLHLQEPLPSIKHSAQSNIGSQSKSPKSEDSVIQQNLTRLKQKNQSEFSNVIKKKYDNKQMEKAVMKIKSKPLDYPTINSSFLPPLVKFENLSTFNHIRNMSAPDTDTFSAELANQTDRPKQVSKSNQEEKRTLRKQLREINTEDNEAEDQAIRSKIQSNDHENAENVHHVNREESSSGANLLPKTTNDGQTPTLQVTDEQGIEVDPNQQMSELSLVKLVRKNTLEKGQTARDVVKEKSESSNKERLIASHRKKADIANRERTESSKKDREEITKPDNLENKGTIVWHKTKISPEVANNELLNKKERGKNGKKGKSEKKFLNSYVNPLYKDGRFIASESLPNLHYKRPKIAKKYKNSVKIQYPNVHIDTNIHVDVSFAETSIDTDTYKYYKNLHQEYFNKRNLKRAELFEDLMKMDLKDKFQGIAGEIEKFKEVKRVIKERNTPAENDNKSFFVTKQ